MEFIFSNILIGISLAMDAFSVSVANGIANPKMKFAKCFAIAGTFAAFQFAMPLVGWILVHTIAEKFLIFHKAVPYIAFGLLLFIGISMIAEGLKKEKDEASEENESKLSVKKLLIQGVATSIDALSVGFTIADYGFLMAFYAALIIMAVTLVLCLVGVKIGNRIGILFAKKATIIGGIILILLGIKIFVQGVIIPLLVH